MDSRSRTLLAVLMFMYGLLNIIVAVVFTAAGDWAPLWAAARVAAHEPGSLYDFALITEAQQAILGKTDLRPFVYPPTALLLIAPFAWLPFCVAFFAFVGITGAAYLRQAFRIGAHRALLMAPPVFLAAWVGQTSFAVVAFALAGLSALRSRPVLAGVLLGLAAAIKPTLFVLAPVALLAGGHYRALLAAAVGGLSAIAAAVLWLGVQPWLDWLDAIPRFQALFLANETLVRTAVTPYALAFRFGMDWPWIIPAFAALAVAAAIVTFRWTDEVAPRSVALFGGALLISPYAMNYELALLAPAVMTLPIRKARDLIVPLLFGASLFATASFVGLAAVMTWFAVQLVRERLAVDEPPVERRVHVPA